MFDVLVIDDDVLVRDSITDLLEAEGLRVHATRYPAEGLRVLHWPGTRLILLDLVLDGERRPDLGTSSARGLVEEAARSGVPVVVLSGLPDLARHAAAMGAAAW